jgi:DNA modification methylase
MRRHLRQIVRVTIRLLCGDALEQLRLLPDESVQSCITSPPYWGLRDYGIAGQLGLERTPEEYVEKLVEVFREVRRVLRGDGTLWLNLGDCYNAYNGGAGPGSKLSDTQTSERPHLETGYGLRTPSLKPKDLVGIPWRVAFALQADGWWLRRDIIWHKPNPMPESVTDRPTSSHEYVFLLTKSARYYYDGEAIKEPADGRTWHDLTGPPRLDVPGQTKQDGHGRRHSGFNARYFQEPPPASRNRRSVWTIPTQSFPEAHFATFPEALVEPCIAAGSRGPGKRCDCDRLVLTPTGSGPVNDPTLSTGRAGMNRPRRPDEGTRPITRREQRHHAEEMKRSPVRDQIAAACGSAFTHYIRTDDSGARPLPEEFRRRFLAAGWLTEAPPCSCPMAEGDTVLDPFCGSGTVGVVALRAGRDFIGIDLSPRYVEMARRRIEGTAPLFAEVKT